MFCLYKAGTFFIRQDEIPLETDRISAKAEEKSPYKCFVPGWFWNSAIMWLEVANECIQKKTKQKKLSTDELNVEPWLTFFQGFLLSSYQKVLVEIFETNKMS